ncbi:MAG: cadherin-like beta sandwich domain-containing protein [Clostridia bacterium]|nr:cadherin-like beta sandwich domain-containing protein [Clostridia bacterium]
MKKILSLLTVFLCCTMVCHLPIPPVFADDADQAPQTSTAPEIPNTDETPATDDSTEYTNSVSLTAPKALRAGEEVTFTFVCEGDSLRAAQGSVTYDPAVLTYVGSQAIPEDWEMTFSEGDGVIKYLGLSTENRGLSGKAELFSLTFRIADSAAEGNGIPFTLSDATVYDGNRELLLTGGEFTWAVTRPLSTQCTLEALSVVGGNLSPAFSPEITAYSVTLPYTVYYADISATACEYGQIKLSSRELKVGENEIRVTVISESGLQQVYTITVTRLADPNYVPSSDNRILSLDLSDGLLFPSFSPEITEYTVYLVKGQDVILTPTAADKGVAQSLTIPAEPAPGSTLDEATAGTFTIVCSAEDGTPRTYTFHTILLDTPEELEKVQTSVIAESPLTAILIFSFAAVTIFFLGFVVSHLFHARNGKKESAPTKEETESK